jgi:hypothetical protein
MRLKRGGRIRCGYAAAKGIYILPLPPASSPPHALSLLPRIYIYIYNAHALTAAQRLVLRTCERHALKAAVGTRTYFTRTVLVPAQRPPTPRNCGTRALCRLPSPPQSALFSLYEGPSKVLLRLY